MNLEYDPNNIFNKIINSESKCKKCYEDDEFLVIHDKYPVYETHLLLLPKKQFVSFDDFIKKSDKDYIASYFKVIEKVTSDLGIDEYGYKILTNHKKAMGQEIFHFHTHIMSGKKLPTSS